MARRNRSLPKSKTASPTPSGVPPSRLRSKRHLTTPPLEMASRGLRTLALTYNDLNREDYSFGPNGEALDEAEGGKKGFGAAPEEDLILLVIVGIKVAPL